MLCERPQGGAAGAFGAKKGGSSGTGTLGLGSQLQGADAGAAEAAAAWAALTQLAPEWPNASDARLAAHAAFLPPFGDADNGPAAAAAEVRASLSLRRVLARF